MGTVTRPSPTLPLRAVRRPKQWAVEITAELFKGTHTRTVAVSSEDAGNRWIGDQLAICATWPEFYTRPTYRLVVWLGPILEHDNARKADE